MVAISKSQSESYYRSADLIGPEAIWLLSTALDSIDHGVMIVNLDGELLVANRAADIVLDGAYLFRRNAAKIIPGGDWPDTSWIGLLRNLEPGRVRVVSHAYPLNGEFSLERMPGAASMCEEEIVLIGMGRTCICSQTALESWARRTRLTRAEQRVVCLIAQGNEPKAAAAALNISEHTIRTHIRRILEKAGSRNIKCLIRTLALLPAMSCPERPNSADLAKNHASLVAN